MSRLHRALVASVSSLVASAAFAQTAEIKPSVTPYGIIQNYLTLHDSQRQNDLDGHLMVARIGFKANYGLAIGQIELQATGNGCDSRFSHAKDPKTKAETDTDTNTCVDKNQISVRRADVGLAIKATDTVTITPSFGRVRPGDIGGWGVDATNVTDGFGSMDGAQLAIKADLGEGNSLEFGANYGNAILNPANTAGNILHSGGNSPRDRSGDNTRGYVLSAKAAISNIKAAVFYGAEKNHMVSKVGTAGGFVTPVDAAAKLTVADFSRWEAALGVDYGNIAGGFTAWQYNTGKAKTVDEVENGKLVVGDETGAEASSNTNYGLGVNGDSTLFGLADLLQKDDKLTFGASVVRNVTDPGKSAPSEYSTQIALGGGYSLGGLQIELNVAHTVGKREQFSNKKGDEQVKTNNLVYLSSVYVF